MFVLWFDLCMCVCIHKNEEELIFDIIDYIKRIGLSSFFEYDYVREINNRN